MSFCMRIFFIFIALFAVLPAYTALAVSCPSFTDLKITPDEAIEKIDACAQARAHGTTKDIDEYQCPAGEFVWESKEPLTSERLAYHITVNLMMNELDTRTKEYMQKLHESRDKDAVAWTENIRSCVRDQGDDSHTLADAYYHICRMTTIADFLQKNSNNRTMIMTTDTYPQTLCEQIAAKKIHAWELLGTHLMHNNIHKSFQNDHDRFVDRLQNSYDRVLARFHQYQRMVARASAKIKVYIRNPVR